MSYILDALRKSDQLRQRGAAPTLLLGQSTATAPRQPARIYYVVLALVLLGAGIAIGWLRPWQPEPVVPPPVAIGANPTAASQSQLPALSPDTQPKPKPEPDTQARNTAPATEAIVAPTAAPAGAPARASAQAPASAAATAPQSEENDLRIKKQRQSAPRKVVAAPSTKAAQPVPAQTPGVNTLGTADAGSAAAATAPLASAVAMAELPLAIQQELPPLSISVHAYSSKVAERLVGINGRLLHEGDFAASGLRLEQITPDGMVLSYKGYSFRRGVH